MKPKTSIRYALVIVLLLASPSLFARAMHEITGDPLWRWMAIDEQQIAISESAFSGDGPSVRVRIYWMGPDETYDTPQDLAFDVRRAFETKGIASYIAVIEGSAEEAGQRTTLEVQAGSNVFGPFLVRSAAGHIQPAAEAARLAYRPEATEEHRW